MTKLARQGRFIVSRIVTMLFTVILSLGLLAGCRTPNTPTPTPKPTRAARKPTATPQPTLAAKKFTIAVSNVFLGNDWTGQMIGEMREINKTYLAENLTNELLIENTSADAQGQIQQIRDLMTKGVDAILIYPSDATALNPVVEQAIAAGIVVISVGGEISAKGAINVTVDQAQSARASAQWLVNKMGGRGSVVMINSVSGYPANEARAAAADEVFLKAGINLLAKEDANGVETTAQGKMTGLLAKYPNVNGVWVQEGGALGALQALEASNQHAWPFITGETSAGYLQEWQNILNGNPDFESFGVINPPGQGVDGFQIAMNLLQGKKLKDGLLAGAAGNTLYVPAPGQVDSASLGQFYNLAKSKATLYFLDSVMSQTEIDALFK